MARSDDDDAVGEFAVLEVGAALRLTRVAAQHEVAFAEAVTRRLPRVGELLRDGVIDLRRARALVDGTAHLPVHTARRVVAEVAGRAPELTTGQLRARLRKLCLTIDPEDAATRMEHAVRDRRVVLEATSDGTANLLLLDLPADLATAARDHIDWLARQLPSGDERTMDQRRADAALDLLCGHGEPVGRGTVDITVDLRTLLELSDRPGDLGAYGPVVAEMARPVVDRQTDCRWLATVTDDRGDPLTVAVRRRPTTHQARQVRARYRTCVFPGCRRSAPGRRPRPHHPPRRRRPHRRTQPRPTVSIPPPSERRRRMALRPSTRRRPRVDQPTRPHLCQQWWIALMG